jgi:phosphatidylserine/phosphatidylglycerophosphate/cardiolipin synthase-like enzyme
VATFADRKIEAFVGPRALGAADDLEAEIVRFIDAAEDSVDVAVQELDSAPIAEALIRKRLARKSVRLVLNHSYLMEDEPPPPNGAGIDRWAGDAADHKVNRDIFAALSRCQVEVRLDFNHAHIFHQKFVVRDLRLRSDGRWQAGGHPALLTGSANFTDTDTHTNLNHVLVFHHRDVAEEYGKEFAEIYGGEFGRGRIGDKPKTFDVGGVPVKVLFAPDHGPEAEIIKQLLKCPPGDSIRFAVFTFSGSSGIDDALLVLHGAGRLVHGVVDRGQSSHDWSAAKWLVEGGIEIRVPRRREGLRKLHHKLMVIGDSTVVAGSFNYTEPANLFNDENLLVCGAPYETSEGVEVNRDECKRLAGHLTEEIDRILADSEPWRPPRPPER